MNSPSLFLTAAHRQPATSRLSLVTLLLMVVAFVCPVSGWAAPPDVPANMGTLYYRLGGGKSLPPPGAFANSFNITSRFKVGLGYSCGKFDFQNNITKMVNQFKAKARQLPGQMTMAAQAAVVALPGYLLQKKNPTLYNLITKTLDETANLFNMSFKSCQDIEREMQKNPGANPYQGFVQASVADIWSSGAAKGDVIADVATDVRSAPAKPIKWIGGALYGTAANPVQINRDIVVAGYNIMIGRTGDVSVTAKPVGAMALEPIVQIWDSPATAGRWVQEVLGDTKIVLEGGNAKEPESIPGKGLRPKVALLEQQIDLALTDALDNDDYQDINKFTSVRISSALTESLRNMPAGERAVLRDRLVSELAVSEARERMMLIKQMIMTGLRAPDLVASTGGSVAEKYIRENTFPDMNRVIREIFDALELKQRTVNKTTIAILNRAEENRRADAAANPSQMREAPNALSGAVKK